MSWGVLLEILTSVGSAAGAIITIAGLWGLLAKKPKNWFKKIIREEIDESNNQMKIYINEHTTERLKEMESINGKLGNIEQRLSLDKDATICALRHSITKIYEEYKNKKVLPINIKEDLCSMYESYANLGGNSFVHTIYEEMIEWDVE